MRDKVKGLVEKLKAQGYAITPEGWETVERILRDGLESLLEAANQLRLTMETCHVCKCTLVLESSPVHCQSCSGDCDDHEEPDCTPIYILHRALDAELQGWLRKE